MHHDEAVTEHSLEQAVLRGRRNARRVRATAVEYQPDSHALFVAFAEPRHIAGIVLLVAAIPEFAGLSRTELEAIVLGFGGSALCLDARDLHVSLAGLVFGDLLGATNP